MSSKEASTGADAMPSWRVTILQWRLDNEQGMSVATTTRIRSQLQQRPQQIPNIPLPIQQLRQPVVHHASSSSIQHNALLSNTPLANQPASRQNLRRDLGSLGQQTAFVPNTPPAAQTVYLRDLHHDLDNSLIVVYGDYLNVSNTPLTNQTVCLQEYHQTAVPQPPLLPAAGLNQMDLPNIELNLIDDYTEDERRQFDIDLAQYIQQEPMNEEMTPEETFVETNEE